MKKSLLFIALPIMLTGCAELQEFQEMLKPKPINVTATQICNEFYKNPTRAKETYIGKYIQSSGPISISDDMFSDIYGDKNEGTIFIKNSGNVKTHVSKYPKSKILKLNNGDKTTVLGRITNISTVASCFVGVDYVSD